MQVAESMWSTLETSLERRAGWMSRFRRELHATPETSGAEFGTTAKIAGELRDAGIQPRIMSGDTGIVVDLDLGAPNTTTVALRAELDCVEVADRKDVDYRSQTPGLCHACGHDAHSTILLSTALALQEHLPLVRSEKMQHNVRLIFQPAEETATGARSMIDQGVLEDVTTIAALHVDPFLPVGSIGVRNGPMTAAAKLFKVTVRGRGGHSARPHEAIDPIPAATMLVSQLYMLGPRSMDSRYPLALTVGSVTSGQAYNAIPSEAAIRGTLRATRPEDLAAVETRMKAIVEGVSRSTGCDMTLDFIHSAPQTANDPHLVEQIGWVAREALGEGAVTWLETPSLGGEDFAFYQHEVPGVFVRLGAALDDGREPQPLHSPFFDINEDALLAGARFMLRSAVHLAAASDG